MSWRRTSSPAIRSATPEPHSFSLRPATILKDCGRKPASHRCAGQSGSRIVGKDRQASAQPWRRSRRQLRVAHHRHRSLANRPEDQGLRRSPTFRGAFQTRRHSNPEALPRQGGLHAHHAAPQGNQRHANRRLTNRRASRARSSPRPPSPARSPRPASPSPWTAAAAGWTTCSSSGCGGR
jgi:hypothetical protein